MKEPQLNPQVADLEPTGPELTVYDEEHWREVCRIVLRIDPDTEADRARLAFESHLSLARWMTEQGYRHLLRNGNA
jgi:hypothetical protein